MSPPKHILWPSVVTYVLLNPVDVFLLLDLTAAVNTFALSSVLNPLTLGCYEAWSPDVALCCTFLPLFSGLILLCLPLMAGVLPYPVLFSYSEPAPWTNQSSEASTLSASQSFLIFPLKLIIHIPSHNILVIDSIKRSYLIYINDLLGDRLWNILNWYIFLWNSYKCIFI